MTSTTELTSLVITTDDTLTRKSISLPASPTILTTTASSSSCDPPIIHSTTTLQPSSSTSSSNTASTAEHPPSIPSIKSSSAIDRIPYKRSSSSSNDLIYERDRFRARLLTLNDGNEDLYDGIGYKTAKLNINVNPLDPTSTFYKQLQTHTDGHINIKILDPDRLKSVFGYYFNSPLPKTTTMFPWLHGLHKDNFSQKSFFLYQQQQLKEKYDDLDIFPDFHLSKPKHIRFLMCITDESQPITLKNTVNLSEILQKIDVSKTEVRNIIEGIFNEDNSLIDLLTTDCIQLNVLPIFLNLDPDRGISLRNFHIQVAKLSTCSDFILYGSDIVKIESMARILWLAQRYEKQQQSVSDEEVNDYNVFIFDSIPNDNTLIYDTDIKLLEKLETTKMSSATKLHNNVWIGNYHDHQIMMNYILEDKPVTPTPHPESLANLYNDPTNSIITSHTVLLIVPRANWRLFVQCHIDAQFPSLSTLSHLLFIYSISSHDTSSEYHSLEFPPSGSIGIGDCKGENLQSIINTCKLIYLYSSSASSSALSSLIYCSDGYTECSLLVLSYLMYMEDVPLEDAILSLHLKYGRPFYIFNSDVIILRKLQPLLRKFSPKRRTTIDWGKLDTLTNQDLNEILLGPVRTVPKLGHIHNSDDESDEEDEIEIDWVKEVEGSLPSKILPYLYLGSLKHASCLPLLSKLEITHIISVGETLPWLNGYKFLHNNEITHTKLAHNMEVSEIFPKHGHGRHTTVKSVMKVNNLEDDGIDELARQLPHILHFIENHYQHGKILVHCRVGVSRSATVVIAEIMKRLNVSLHYAYLFTRVRRLNIIIQPNLRFMYELFKWEEKVKLKQKENGKFLDGTVMLREIDWFIMCREIMKLNIPYLNN